MSDQDVKNRPGQVTVAGWAIAVGSVMLVFAIFDSMGNLHSVDMRDQVTKALTSDNGAGLGLSVEQALDVIRVMLFVAGAGAAAAAVLGGFVLRRNRGARLGVTIAAVPILLCGPFSGGLLAAVVAASVVVLWTRPARDWFAGRPVTQRKPRRPVAGDGEDRRTPPPVFSPPVNISANQPPPTVGFGAPAGGQDAGPQPGPAAESGQGGKPMSSTPGGEIPPQPYPPSPYQPYPPQPPAYYGAGPGSSSRPGTVTAACVVTFVAAGLTALMSLLLMLLLTVARTDLVDEIERSAQWRDLKTRPGAEDITPDTIVAIFWALAVIVLVWTVVAVVMAVLTWKGHNWARIVLIVSASVTALVCLIGLPVSLVHLAAAVAVIVLLALSTSGRWFHQSGSWQSPPPPPSWPPAGEAPRPPEAGQQPPEDRPKVW